MKRQLAKIMTFFGGSGLFLLYSDLALAYSRGTVNHGVASNLLDFERTVQGFIQFIALVTGVALLLFSLSAFKSHRKNPVNVRLSKPISMVIFGIALIILSFIPMPV